jgi:nitrite reductase/ring-hydroxylating ferredoxin subunit
MRYFLFCLLAISFTAKPIVIRHDVDDSEYKEFAKSDNSTVTFYCSYKGEEVVAGTGAIIADRWVVTAAHVAKYLVRSGKVQFKESFYQIENVVRHPLWQDQQFPNDIALVKLTASVENVTIARLYGSSNEKGKTATLVGRGDHGNGIDGVVGSDKNLRAAKNV